MSHPIVRRSRLARAFALTAAGALAVGVTAAVPASAADGVLPAGAQASSKNVKLMANTPKPGAFAGETSYSSDLAFQGKYAFQGNYDGFNVYDVSAPANPKLVVQVVCPGSQNDVSVQGNLLFLSTDSSRNKEGCDSVAQPATVKESWEGIKIFDISTITSPKLIKSVETDCGSHTHTLVPGKGADAAQNAYLYVSSYRPNDAFPDCKPPHDKISIVKVPLGNPTAASVAATPVLFPDGGYPGRPTTPTTPGGSDTSGCHDITVFAEKDLAAGACMGDGVLMDISDRLAPKVLNRVQDTENFAFWHSATFNNEGTKVVFTDELGGGGAATCTAAVGPKRGANAIYDITGSGAARALTFKSYYKIPRMNSSTENCVAHNGSLIPVKGKDIMVQAWYQGGISVWDFTDSAKPKEIGWFDRGALNADKLVLGGSWSAYWYNGSIISSDIQKGLDVLRVNDPRTNEAKEVVQNRLNVQTQTSY